MTASTTGEAPAAPTTPVVGIVMGSDSDWPTMSAAAEILDSFGITYSVEVVSAHRMPHEMIEWGTTAADRGLRVVIAGAGGAAHLPGMIASVTSLPVIGVPVPLTYLDGMDSLLSIVQMPGGVPVATVSIGNAKNAGLLAARILGAGTGADAEAIRSAMDTYRGDLRAEAEAKGAKLAARVGASAPGAGAGAAAGS
ncbi:5-(carboxyamino)imidazole ribonucleotide mutase [Brevibacterium samyangense]|uniref:N5-carboxyaminoimidazole ribonucleotide mutase n=1 Tax=Brevibacterium samyangense TaxID=366888 RepID=A0ABP5EWW6_9MICO